MKYLIGLPELLLFEQANKLVLDCGDNSCEFAIKKGGMRTNGGCRCLDKSIPFEIRQFIRRSYKYMPELIELARKQISNGK